MTDLEPGIHVYSMPMCIACKRWKEWLEMEQMPYVDHHLSELPGDVGGSLPDALNASQSQRAIAGEAIDIAPVILSVHEDRHVALIAEGTEPLFWCGAAKGGNVR